MPEPQWPHKRAGMPWLSDSPAGNICVMQTSAACACELVTAPSVQALCGLPRLQTLDLTSNRLQDLPAAPGPASLRDLWLEANRLQDADALLRSLSAASCLTSLTLYGNPCAGAGCTERVWTALPGLQQLDELTRPTDTSQ